MLSKANVEGQWMEHGGSTDGMKFRYSLENKIQGAQPIDSYCHILGWPCCKKNVKDVKYIVKVIYTLKSLTHGAPQLPAVEAKAAQRSR